MARVGRPASWLEWAGRSLLDITATQIGIAAGLGLLVGLQREWAKQGIAGIRTFPLITLFGAICAMLADAFGGWVVVVGLGAVSMLVLTGDFARVARGKKIEGVTTEMAALVMFGVGALCVVGPLWVTLVLAGAVLVLLQFKQRLHGLVGKVQETELTGVAQLALLGMVVLPVLPDRTIDPYGVVNPRHAWMMVVLIVGLSLVGHVVRRVLGRRSGLLAAGVLGGLVSSTATTVSEARRDHGGAVTASALVITLASLTSVARLLVEVAVAAPGLLPTAGPPLGALLVGSSLTTLAVAMLVRDARGPTDPAEHDPDIWGAVVFGGLYVLALLAVAFTQERFGDDALYVVGFLSGLTDVDAITLSTSTLAVEGRLPHEVAWRVILVAVVSNTLFKVGLAAMLGGRRLGLRTLGLLTPLIVLAAVLFQAWPG